MKVPSSKSYRQVCGWMLLSAAGFAAGWFLKPAQQGREAVVEKARIRQGGVVVSSAAAESAGDAFMASLEGRPLGARARYLPKDGKAPATLVERLRFTFADSRGGMQELDFARLIGEMQVADAPAILAMLNEVEGERNVEVQRRALFLQWGELAPAEALATIKKEKARLGERSLMAAGEIMQGWAAKDMNGALAALNSEDLGSFRTRLLGGLVVTFAGQDLAKCTQWALTQDKGDQSECGQSLGWVAATTFGIDAGNAWYKELPNDGHGGVKESAWRGMIATAEKTGGKALMDLMLSSSDLPWCRSPQVANGLKAASAQGVTAGLDFVAALPAGGLQKLSGNLGAVFQEASFAEAGAWLKSHRTAACYDFLASEFAGRLRKQDPEAAAPWVNTISDPALRARAGGNP